MSRPVFNPVPPDFSFSGSEGDISRFWKEGDIYAKSLARRREGKPFVFYEGPPTANGMPHPGHCLTRTIKDIFPRYKTMDGHYCERKAGWDTHGLPVEIEVCKELGIMDGGKAAIEAYGVEKFNRACVESVFRYQKEWENLTDRIGFWVNLDEAYVTFHQSYVESVWWSLKQLFDRGLLYQGHKVVWWWAQGGTALSAGEVGEGYRDVDDPAITVRLPLTPESAALLGVPEETSLLVWTTTPWTLSSNCAACVGADIEYCLVRDTETGGCFILAKALASKHFGDDAVPEKVFPGSALLGVKYAPLFAYDLPQDPATGREAARYWEVIPGDFVDLETGTGIVHMAPAFGEDDYRVCREQGIGFLCFVRPDGTFDERVTDKDPFDGAPIAGRFCKEADKSITRVLKERGFLLKHEQYRHSYPFCPRAENDPLIQYARKSWFIRTSEFRDRFLANNAEINWQPGHIRDGRFGNFLENNVDWALSRERFWGTPLPIWVCEKTGHMECVASYAELLAKPGVEGVDIWEAAKQADPSLRDDLRVHKPYIDAVTYQSPKDPSARMRRVTEVIDVWYDAGSMPFAQWGYPHVPGSEELLAGHFPADFISEGIDQTRGWFYALLAISTLIFGEDRTPWPHPYKNCICLGLVHGEDGLKLSKRLKNYKDPGELFDQYSADALRWSLISKNPPTTGIRMTERNVEEAQREMLIRWHNVYSFFVIYANLDGFSPSDAPAEFLAALGCDPAVIPSPAAPADRPAFRPAAERCELDQWILNELARTVIEVRSALDQYETYPAARALSSFLDGLSNWYVRRSRSRFWAGAWSADKTDAYWTLYECLVKFAQLMAPFTPFYAEATWRNLAAPLPGAPESVHISDFPRAKAEDIDWAMIADMALTREAVTLGLNARRTANLKVRQPLGLCEIVLSDPARRHAVETHRDLILEELNIKELAFTENPDEYVTYLVKPNFKVLGPKHGPNVKKIGQLLAAGSGAAFFAQMRDTGRITLPLDGQDIELGPDDVEVRLQPREGFSAAQGAEMVVVLSTEITEELRHEGWVRDFVRVVQDMRKELNVAYDARITLELSPQTPELAEVLRRFEAAISETVLAREIRLADQPGAGARMAETEGGTVSVLVRL